MNELLTLTLIELAEALRERKASPVELMEATLADGQPLDLQAHLGIDGDPCFPEVLAAARDHVGHRRETYRGRWLFAGDERVGESEPAADAWSITGIHGLDVEEIILLRDDEKTPSFSSTTSRGPPSFSSTTSRGPPSFSSPRRRGDHLPSPRRLPPTTTT